MTTKELAGGDPRSVARYLADESATPSELVVVLVNALLRISVLEGEMRIMKMQVGHLEGRADRLNELISDLVKIGKDQEV